MPQANVGEVSSEDQGRLLLREDARKVVLGGLAAGAPARENKGVGGHGDRKKGEVE